MKNRLLCPVLLCLAFQPLLFAGSLQERVHEAALVSWIHGMTAEIAEREVGTVGVPYLLELLQDPDFERRDNVVAFLTFLANDGDAAAIADYLDHPPVRNDSPEEFRARLIVPEALGRIAARGGPVAADILRRMNEDPDVARMKELAEQVKYGLSLIDGNTEVEPAPGDPLDPGHPAPLSLDPNPAHHVHDLTYSNHVATNNPITDAEVDEALEHITQVVATQNASNDTACCIEYVRTQPGAQFGSPGDGLDVIQNGAELNAVINNPSGRIKVVDYIGYCGGPGNNILGCAETPGNGIVLIRSPPPNPGNEGKLWIHEFGHNTGLGHNPTFGFIMYGGLAAANTKLNGNECNRFHFPSGAAQATPVQIGVCHDSDGDNIMSTGDNCPNVANAGQADIDVDWVGDVCDNCVSDPNPTQEDCDTDGLGDVCDPEIIIPEEIEGIWFATNEELFWDPIAFRKYVYRGVHGGGTWHYNHSVVATLNSANFWIDETVPPSGTFSYYLVTAWNGCGESP